MPGSLGHQRTEFPTPATVTLAQLVNDQLKLAMLYAALPSMNGMIRTSELTPSRVTNPF